RLLGSDGSNAGDLAADQLYFVVAQLLDQFRACSIADQDQEYGGLASAAQYLRVLRIGDHRYSPPLSVNQERRILADPGVSLLTLSRRCFTRTSAFFVVTVGNFRLLSAA